MSKQRRYGPELKWPVEIYGERLNTIIVAYMLAQGGVVPRGVRVPWRTWIHIWNQPRLMKKWGFKRYRRVYQSKLEFLWHGHKITLIADEKDREGTWRP